MSSRPSNQPLTLAEPVGGGDVAVPGAAHILVAEDSALAAKLVCDELAREGHRTVHLPDGDSAFEAFLAHGPFDLVMTDGEMPGRDGVALCRAIREHDPALPIIFVTASADRVVEALDAGADDYIRKPFEPAELRARVRAALRTGELRRQIEAERDRSTALVASLQDGLAVFARDGRIIEANERLAAITGHRRADLVGMTPPFPFWPPELCAEYGGQLREALTGGVEGECDRTYLRPSGERIEVIVSLAPLSGVSDPRAGGFVATVKDITARRTAERELRRSEERHRVIAEEQARLSRVAAGVATSRDPAEVFALVAYEVAGLLGADAAGVSRFEEEHALLVGAWTAVEELRLPDQFRFPLSGDGATARVHREQRPVRIEDYKSLSPRARRGGSSTRMCSVAAPVWAAGQLWGTLGAISTRSGGLAAGSEERLGEFAALVGVAISAADARVELTRQATTDPLTGLANRREFELGMAAAVATATESERPLSVAMFDLDHFKRVNDTFGHAVGDQVLVDFGRRIGAAVRGSDMVARIGGEEFAVVLLGADIGVATRVAERVRAGVAGKPFGEAGSCTISAGVAEMGPGDDAATLLRSADERLYTAKRLGRDRVVASDEE